MALGKYFEDNFEMYLDRINNVGKGIHKTKAPILPSKPKEQNNISVPLLVYKPEIVLKSNIECLICKNSFVYHGFVVKEGFIYGCINDVKYATTGTRKNGKMYIYMKIKEDWIKKCMNEDDELPKHITLNFGEQIILRNIEYNKSK